MQTQRYALACGTHPRSFRLWKAPLWLCRSFPPHRLSCPWDSGIRIPPSFSTRPPGIPSGHSDMHSALPQDNSNAPECKSGAQGTASPETHGNSVSSPVPDPHGRSFWHSRYRPACRAAPNPSSKEPQRRNTHSFPTLRRYGHERIPHSLLQRIGQTPPQSGHNSPLRGPFCPSCPAIGCRSHNSAARSRPTPFWGILP